MVMVIMVGWIGHGVGHRIVDGPVDGDGMGHGYRMGQGYRLGEVERHLLGKLHRDRLLDLDRHVMRDSHYLRHGNGNRVVHRHRHWYVMRHLRRIANNIRLISAWSCGFNGDMGNY